MTPIGVERRQGGRGEIGTLRLTRRCNFRSQFTLVLDTTLGGLGRGRIMRELVLIVLVLFARLGQAPAAFAEKRLALVIGVKAYKSLPVLANTIADAELIAEKLRAADFDVGIVRDPNNAALQEAARSFARKIEDAGRDTVALLYYAGHGVQNKKQVNYIIGADADLKADTDLSRRHLGICRVCCARCLHHHPDRGDEQRDGRPSLLFRRDSQPSAARAVSADSRASSAALWAGARANCSKD